MKVFGTFITKLYSVDCISLLPILGLLSQKTVQLPLDDNPDIPFRVKEWPKMLHSIQIKNNHITIFNKQLNIGEAFAPLFKIISQSLQLSREDSHTASLTPSLFLLGTLDSA